jgi:hypothetical protein
MSGWKPIEVAPKDGTYVLVVNASAMTGPGQMWIGAFRHAQMHEPWEPSKQWRDYSGRYSQPTHWMLLPAPPVLNDRRIAPQRPRRLL